MYDSGGKRIKKLVRKFSGWESVTYVDEVFEYHKKGSDEKNYIQLGGGIEIRVGEYSGETSGTAIIYQLKDHLGSVGIRIGQSGDTIDREEYHPFGDSSLKTFTQKRYRYCGKEKDEESGLYYYGARYYAAWVGRFISVDPLAGNYPFYTPYNYPGNRPINSFDIDGMQDKDTAPVQKSVGSPVAQSIAIANRNFINGTKSSQPFELIPSVYTPTSGQLIMSAAKAVGMDRNKWV